MRAGVMGGVRSISIWFLVASAAAACTVRSSGTPQMEEPRQAVGAPPPGEEPAQGGTGVAVDGVASVEEIRDDAGKVYRVDQGASGEPGVVGCADGQRELFVDAARFPGIAGCLGGWQGTKDMRARATGGACGDDSGECAVPADLCAPGWRLCGATGAIADLKQVTGEECATAGGGRFSAALSHCETQSGCTYDTRPDGDYGCFKRGWCSETVCCGADCGALGACTDGVWPGKTHIAIGQDQGCGATSSRRAGGVLCCRG